MTLSGNPIRRLYGLSECSNIFDYMVRGQDQHYRVRGFLRDDQGSGGDRRGRIPCRWLQNDGVESCAYLAKLFGNQEPMILVTHRDR